PPDAPGSLPGLVKDLVPSEYSYSDTVVAGTDEAHDDRPLPFLSTTTTALRTHIHIRSAASDRNGEEPRMAWEEWEQLKTAAVERQSTRMELNQLPADQGGTSSTSGVHGPPSGGLRSDKVA